MKITLIVDRSGSMIDKAGVSTQGINELITSHKKNKEVRFNLIEFDNEIKVVAKDKKKIKGYELIPRGSTAMYDGIGEALSMLNLDEKNLVVIVTDGYENSSRTWSQVHINPLIKAMEKAGVEFIFLGAGIDAFKEANSLGINPGSSIQMTRNTAGNFQAAFTGVTATTNSMVDGNTLYGSLGSAFSDTANFRRSGSQYKPEEE